MVVCQKTHYVRGVVRIRVHLRTEEVSLLLVFHAVIFLPRDVIVFNVYQKKNGSWLHFSLSCWTNGQLNALFVQIGHLGQRSRKKYEDGSRVDNHVILKVRATW